MVRVVKIVPQHLPEFDEIAEKVTADWEHSEKQRLEMEWCSNNFKDAIEAPEKWGEVVKNTNCTSQTLSVSVLDLVSGAVSQDIFSANDLSGIMLLKKNQVEFRVATNGKVVAVRVNRVEREVANVLRTSKTDHSKGMKERLLSGFTGEISSLAEQSIRNLYNVKIRQESINKVRALSSDE
jgi:hypothetical protein